MMLRCLRTNLRSPHAHIQRKNSALARAGKAVLLLDAADFYGGAWASLPGPAFAELMREARAPLPPAAAEAPQQQPQQQPAPSDPLPDGARLVPLALRPVAAHFGGAKLYAAAGSGSGGGGGDAAASSAPAPPFPRACVVDLAPRALLQAERLVDALVASRASRYLDLKLVDGSYIWRPPPGGGGLAPVPASKADIFGDRSLAAAEKRSLMRFLRGAAEAAAGEGPLAGAFDGRPLGALLAGTAGAGGGAGVALGPRLADVVAYGIALCDTPQPVAAAAEAGDGSSGGGSNPVAAAAAAAGSSTAGVMTAAEALAALRLYGESLGRYGGRGALMAPCYGAGAALEAFVRLAAVRGAVSVLRAPAAALVVGGGGSGSGGGAAGEACRGVALASGQVIACDWVVGGPEVAAACEAGGCGHLLRAAGGPAAAAEAAAAPASSSDGGSGGSRAAAAVARAVCLLDGPLVDGDDSLLLVFPPGALGGGGGGGNGGDGAAAAAGSPMADGVVVRGLQVGPALQAAPAGRWLLYLSAILAPGCGADADADAEALLRPALEAVADATALGSSCGGGSGAAAAASAGNLAEGGRRRPRVLAAAFYLQRLDGAPGAAAAAAAAATDANDSSSGVIACPGPDGALVGFSAALAAAEALFRRRFPALPWLSDAAPAPREAAAAAAAADGDAAGDDSRAEGADGEGAGGTGAGAGATAGGADDDGDDDEAAAIDELTAALAELGMELPPPPPPQ